MTDDDGRHTHVAHPRSAPAADALLASVRAGTLHRRAWTHEAHVAVAWALHRQVGDPAETLGELRGLITAYNARSGLPAERVICHETITRYHLAAVMALAAQPLEVVQAHPWCSCRAPLRHWRRAVLASEAARRTWVAPDLAPLPWAAPLDDPRPP
jgi:hypothetical protein